MQAIQNLVYSLTRQNLGQQQASRTQVRLNIIFGSGLTLASIEWVIWELGTCHQLLFGPARLNAPL